MNIGLKVASSGRISWTPLWIKPFNNCGCTFPNPVLKYVVYNRCTASSIEQAQSPNCQPSSRFVGGCSESYSGHVVAVIQILRNLT